MSTTYGRARIAMDASGYLPRTARKAGSAMIASPTQFVARIKILNVRRLVLLEETGRYLRKIHFRGPFQDQSPRHTLAIVQPGHFSNFVRLFPWSPMLALPPVAPSSQFDAHLAACSGDGRRRTGSR